jgi:hypothetical protein
MVQPPEITDTQAARLALKKLSDDKISRWPNTLAARRKHKEEARSRRLKAEEDARLANDKRLAAERALDRKVRIERANRMIYEQTDRMKVLRSKRMMADIQKHREKQVKSKKSFGRYEVEIERLWQLELKRQMSEYDKKEELEKMKREKKHIDLAVTQKKQLEEYKQRYIDRLYAEREEGLRIAEQCVREVKEDKAKEQAIKNRAKANMVATMKGNEELKLIRAKLAEEEAKEDAKIAAYAKAKENRVRMRAEREKEQFDRAQAKRQQIIDAATKRLAEFTSNSEQRLANQIAEARAKEDEKAANKAEKQRLMREAIEESRLMQLEMARKRKEEDDALAEEMSRRWKERSKQLSEAEKRDRREAFERNKAHQLFLLKQVEEKNNRASAEREADLREAAFAAKINEEDEGRFYKEVEKALIEMKEEDPELNTLPVKRCFNIKEGLMEAF